MSSPDPRLFWFREMLLAPREREILAFFDGLRDTAESGGEGSSERPNPGVQIGRIDHLCTGFADGYLADVGSFDAALAAELEELVEELRAGLSRRLEAGDRGQVREVVRRARRRFWGRLIAADAALAVAGPSAGPARGGWLTPGVLVATVALALALWLFLAARGRPSPAETGVLVGGSLGVVLVARGLWRRLAAWREGRE